MRLLLAAASATALLLTAAAAPAGADVNQPVTLPYSQPWSNTGLITVNDNWSGVPGVQGFLGSADLATPTDARSVTTDFTDTDVIANQANPNTLTNGGVAEFDRAPIDPVVALQGSGTADAPNLVFRADTTQRQNLTLSFNARDIDGSPDNAVQQIAVQYRVGTGAYTRAGLTDTEGYVADATAGGSATQTTPVNVTLPDATDNQAAVYLRVLTTNATGSDEWVGIDDISVMAAAIPPPPSPLKITETRFGGPGGATDEFVEVTNNGTGPVSIAGLAIAACASGGLTTISAAVPSSTMLGAGQSYRFAGAAFAGAGVDQALTGDIPGDTGVRLQDGAATPNVIDSVGVAGNTCAEGTGVPAVGGAGATNPYSYVRASANGGPFFRDANNNASDFGLVATTPESFGSSALLGSITAEPFADPFRLLTGATIGRFSTSAPISSSPNREVLTSDPRGGSDRVLRLRRTLTNNTGSTLTDVRMGITVLTTKRGDGVTTQADLRLISAPGEANAGGLGPTVATTLEPATACDSPPSTANPCGGVNSRVSLPGTVPPNGSISFNLDFAIERGGPFVIFFTPEATTPGP